MIGVALGIPAAFVARPFGHLAITRFREGNGYPAPAQGHLDDASHMNETRIARVVRVEGEADIARAISREKHPISIAGARHSMGGQSLIEDGTILDLSNISHVKLEGELVTIGAGARWHDVIDVLDKNGRAVMVMQSNDGFSIGGSLSVNCHGWQPNQPPIASTVESMLVVTADGKSVRCTRGDELFAHVLGGYGLFGVIVEATLRTTENAMYVSERFSTSPDGYVDLFRQNSNHAGLAFGRLSIDPDALFEEALLTVYRKDASYTGMLPHAEDREESSIARLLFRGEVESDYGKRLRWSIEKRLGNEGGTRATRNQLMHEPVSLFQNRRPEFTDILHEYFVPAEQLSAFVKDAARIVRGTDLLNVTIRNVLEDRDSVLRYAQSDVFSLVMLFAQRRTKEADDRMRALAQDLIEAALVKGGRHYLPYRAFATPDQIRRGYPMLDAFVAKKRALDPDLVFQNGFWKSIT